MGIAEVKPLKREREAMLPFWAELRIPVTVIHGAHDRLGPPALMSLSKVSMSA